MARPGDQDTTRIACSGGLAKSKENWNSFNRPALIELGRWAPPESEQVRLFLLDPAGLARSVFIVRKPESAAGHSHQRAARLVVCIEPWAAISGHTK
jgi:hypothetical protein